MGYVEICERPLTLGLRKPQESKLSVLVLKAAHLLGHEGVERMVSWPRNQPADFLRSLQSHVQSVALL